MYTIDASILVRDIDPNEPEYEDCHTLLQHIDATATPVIVPLLVLAEVAGTVSRTRRDPIRARLFVDALNALPHFTFVTIDETLARRAADLAADYRLRGADAVYVAVAQQFGTMLVTLDREQRTRAAAIVTTRSPAELLAELLPPATP